MTDPIAGQETIYSGTYNQGVVDYSYPIATVTGVIVSNDDGLYVYPIRKPGDSPYPTYPGLVTNAGYIDAAISGVEIVTADSTLFNTATGVIKGAYGAGLANSGTITNAGTIVGDAHSAVAILGLGVVVNQEGGTIIAAGTFGAGVYMQESGATVLNAGLILTVAAGTKTIDGILLNDGGLIVNQSGGTIAAAAGNAILNLALAATVSNAGLIASYGTKPSIDLLAGGTIDNAGGGRITAAGGNAIYVGSTASATDVINEIGGTIAASGTHSAIVFAAATSGEVTNDGMIGAGAANGISLKSAAIALTNSATGTIASATGHGLISYLARDVTNAGTIIAGGTVSAVSLQLGGTVTNQTAGTIAAPSSEGIYLDNAGGTGGAAVINDVGGVITGTRGILVGAGIGSVNNQGMIASFAKNAIDLFAGGTVVNGDFGKILSEGLADAIYVKGAAGTIVNTGLIDASAATSLDAIRLQTGGTVQNAADADILATSGRGVVAYGALGITNDGTIIAGGSSGVSMHAGGNLVNAASGTIQAVSGDGVYINASGSAAATVANGSDQGVALITGGRGIQIFGGAGSVDNAGTIVGLAESAIALDGGGMVTNAETSDISSIGTGDGIYLGAVGRVENYGRINAIYFPPPTETGGEGTSEYGAGAYTFGDYSADPPQDSGGNPSNDYGNYGAGYYGNAVRAAGTPTGVAATLHLNGIVLHSGGGVINQAMGTIAVRGGGRGIVAYASATVANAGLITSTDPGAAVALLAGGQVDNYATISAQDATGVLIAGTTSATGFLANYGTITGGATTDGVHLLVGGYVLNNASAFIGAYDALVFTDAPGSVVNAGTIAGANFAVSFAAGYDNLLLVVPGAVFIGTIDGGNTIDSETVSTLELTAGIGTFDSEIVNFGSIEFDAGAAWTIGTALDGYSEIGAREHEIVAVGGTVENAVVTEGGIQSVDNEGVVSASEITANGTVVVSAGGTAFDVTVGAGGTLIADAQAVVDGGTLDDGAFYIDFSGRDLDTTVDGATNTIGDGETAVGDQVESGYENVSAGGITQGTTVFAGGAEQVFDGGRASATVLQEDGGQFVFSGGTVVATRIEAGGVESVEDTGVVSGSVVESGGRETISSGGIGIDVVISSGGTLIEDPDGLLKGAIIDPDAVYVVSAGEQVGNTIEDGATDTVEDGDVATGNFVDSGGEEIVSSGGTTEATHVSAGGVEKIYDDGVASGTMLLPDDTGEGGQFVFSGGIAENTEIGDGSDEEASDTGVVSASVVDSGGIETISSGGIGIDLVISSGGTLIEDPDGLLRGTMLDGDAIYVVSGGAQDDTTIEEGATDDVDDGDVASGNVVDSGGTQLVSSGGTSDATIVSAGGMETIATGGVASGTMLLGAGAAQAVGASSPDAAAFGGASFGTMVDAGASQQVAGGGVATGTSLLGAGATQTVTAGGGAMDTQVARDATDIVGAGGTVDNTSLSAGGTEMVAAGGVASGTTLLGTGAMQVLGAGGAAPAGSPVAASIGTNVDAGASQQVAGGGAASGTSLLGAGATQAVMAGGAATDTQVASGASDSVGAGGTVDNTGVSAGGTEMVAAGGMASGTTLLGTGAMQVLGAGGAALAGSPLAASFGTNVDAGANQQVAGGGVASDTSLLGAGATQTVMAGGTASNTQVANGASDSVGAGGTVDNTSVRAGGTELVAAGGAASGTTLLGAGAVQQLGAAGASAEGSPVAASFDTNVGAGATQMVAAGGLATDTMVVGAGAAQAVMAGGSAERSQIGAGGAASVADGGVLSDAGVGQGGLATIAAGGTLDGATIAAGGVLAGAGEFAGIITNDGTVSATGGTLDILQGVTGDGIVQVLTGAALEVSGDVIAAQQSIFGSVMDRGSVIGSDQMTIGATGVIMGDGSLTGTMTDDGVVAATGSLEVTGTVAGSGTLFIATGATLQLDGPVGAGVTIEFSGTGTVVEFDQAAVLATIVGEAAGDEVLACFAGGTRITTRGGAVAVECLAPGDLVATRLGGAWGTITWIGHRRIDCRRHPSPQDVWPVTIREGAFGAGLPRRDLRLSPDHAVFAEGVLVPVRTLLNGATIRQEAVDEITYWHVELTCHDVILAEGLPCESYLDTGNRNAFANGGVTVQMHPQFACPDSEAIWEAAGCAKLRISGEAVQRLAVRLRRRARRLGYDAADPPASPRRGAATSDLCALLRADWYVARYPDVAAAGMDPARHYAGWGRREGRMPCPETDLVRGLGLVDPATQVFTMADIVAAGVDPVDHFCAAGWREGRRPNPAFDTEWYRNLHDVPAGMNPLLHYIQLGEPRGAAPAPRFDPVWYRQHYGIGASHSPLAHWLLHRRSIRVSPLPAFDAGAYARAHAATLRPDRDPFAHFLAIGQYQVRSSFFEKKEPKKLSMK